MMRRLLLALGVLALLGIGFALWLLHNARAMPVVRRAEIALPFPCLLYTSPSPRDS